MSELVQKLQRSPWLWYDVLYNLTPSGREHSKCLEILHDFTNMVCNYNTKFCGSDKFCQRKELLTLWGTFQTLSHRVHFPLLGNRRTNRWKRSEKVETTGKRGRSRECWRKCIHKEKTPGFPWSLAGSVRQRRNFSWRIAGRSGYIYVWGKSRRSPPYDSTNCFAMQEPFENKNTKQLVTSEQQKVYPVPQLVYLILQLTKSGILRGEEAKLCFCRRQDFRW